MKLFALLAAVFFALVVAANWLASAYIVPVGFGLVAPAGVYAIGGVLVLRDWLQQLGGVWRTMPLVYAAGLVSWGIGDAIGWTSLEKIAVASVVAFTVSETVEAIIFSPIRRRSLSAGVLVSGLAGNALDSYIFLTIAFGSLAFWNGQFVGKGEAILFGAALTAVRRRAVPSEALA
jgi:uncharacterized PurR-regulated membrane protein YhhQ (DUF165 family)